MSRSAFTPPLRPPSASPCTRSIGRPAIGFDASSSTPRPARPSNGTIRSRATKSAKDEYVSVEPDEIARVIPHGDKTLSVSAFVDLAGVDDLYFDKPYYLAPFGPERRRDLRAGARRHARGQGGGGRAGGAFSARPDGPHPRLRRGSRRLDAELRLRGASGQAGLFARFRRRRSPARCSISPSTSSRPSKAHSIRASSRIAMRTRWPSWSSSSSRARRSRSARRPRAKPTVNLMQALRDSAAAGQAPSGKTAAKKKTGRRDAAKAKPAPPRRKAG